MNIKRVNHNKTKLELQLRCARCDDRMEIANCLSCGASLMGDTIYCYGPKGETWHKCEDCGGKYNRTGDNNEQKNKI